MGGGSNTTSVTIPKWLEGAVQENIASAKNISRIGYTPYYGPDVAAMTPAQIAAMQGTNQMASAFGMPTADVTAGIPTAADYNGMSAYSSGGMYDAALAELKARNPGQYAQIMSLFGAAPAAASGSAAATSAAPYQAPLAGQDRGRDLADRQASLGSGGRSTTSMNTIGSYAPGGVNTRNPNSAINRAAAAATSKSPGSTAPTGGRAASPPATRSTTTRK